MMYALIMRRTTIMLPEGVSVRLRHEARRRGVSVAEVVREAVDRHLPSSKPGGKLSFFAAGEGGPADASERVDAYVRTAVRKHLPRG